jgi:group I intron endonuclease
MIGIYKITSSVGRVYIGQSIDVEKRFRQYQGLSHCKSQVRLYNSLKKHTPYSHIYEVLEECCFEDLNTRERYWQEHFLVMGKKGLNCKLTATSEQKQVMSQQIRSKISKTHIENSFWRGKTQSEEHIRKRAESLSKHVKTDEHKQNISKALKEKPLSEETRAKMSESKKGKERNHNNPFFIDKIEYRTLVDAGQKLNIHPTTINRRLKSDKFINYIYK